jgi:hypothetical protein
MNRTNQVAVILGEVAKFESSDREAIIDDLLSIMTDAQVDVVHTAIREHVSIPSVMYSRNQYAVVTTDGKPDNGSRDSLAFIINMFHSINNDIADQELADDYGDFTCVVPFNGDEETVEYYMHQMENLEFSQESRDKFANYLRTTYGQSNQKAVQ